MVRKKERMSEAKRRAEKKQAGSSREVGRAVHAMELARE